MQLSNDCFDVWFPRAYVDVSRGPYHVTRAAELSPCPFLRRGYGRCLRRHPRSVLHVCFTVLPVFIDFPEARFPFPLWASFLTAWWVHDMREGGRERRP